MKLFAAALWLSLAVVTRVNGVAVLEEKPADETACDGEYTEGTTTFMDFFQADLTDNSLHLGGVMRYSNIGTFENQIIDMIVSDNSVDGTYPDIVPVWENSFKNGKAKYDPAFPQNPNNNGLSGSGFFGVVNLQTTRDKPKSGRGDFKFCVVASGTDTEIVLDRFDFSIYDLDERGTTGIKEKLIIDINQVASYFLTETTEITLSCELASDPDAIDIPVDADDNCPPDYNMVFSSSTAGVGKDNPNIFEELTMEQINRSILLRFVDTSCFTFSYDHYCEKDDINYVGGSNVDCSSYTGGNLLFSGNSTKLEEEGECNTSPPTMAPPTEAPEVAPTEAPEVAPTEAPVVAPTEAPVVAPTEAPEVAPTDAPVVAPTEAPVVAPTDPPAVTLTDPPSEGPVDACEEGNVKIVTMKGVTEFKLTDAVKIISQDTATVTVQLVNAWNGNPQSGTGSIFYNYAISEFSEKCYEKEDVPAKGNIAEITIQCYQLKPFAELEICVADDTMDPITDNAEIPKCCQPQVPSTSGTVCYKIAISCQDTCASETQRRFLRGAE